MGVVNALHGDVMINRKKREEENRPIRERGELGREKRRGEKTGRHSEGE